jgi:hypothetical protein
MKSRFGSRRQQRIEPRDPLELLADTQIVQAGRKPVSGRLHAAGVWFQRFVTQVFGNFMGKNG